MEWALEENIFQKILHKFGKLEVDLFASRLNHKLPKYVALRPDPKAIAVDAFSMSWSNSYFYVFAPFSLTRMILRKIVEDEAEAVLAAPIWPTQSWWPSLLQLLVGHPVQLPNTGHSVSTQPTREEAPTGKTKTGCFSIIREVLESKQIQTESVELIFQSWRSSTKNQYETYLKKWFEFSSVREMDPLKPSVNSILNFCVTCIKMVLNTVP